MEFLVPRSGSQLFEQVLPAMARTEPSLPFAEKTLDFIVAVSRRILADQQVRQWPELAAVAHWMRRAHLEELRRQFLNSHALRLARGIVVHFAPSNVDTIFLYSWVLSLLAGNLNIIRMPGTRRPQLEYLLSILNDVLEYPEFQELSARNAIISYEHDPEITCRLCSHCAVRVLWGGDHTVSTLRQIPIPPLATELAFPDRFSLAAFHAPAVNTASDEQLKTLVHKFFTDTFSFDQMACSSPRLLLWTGTGPEIDAAKKKFWEQFSDYVCEKQLSYPSVVGISRLASVYAYAATGQAEAVEGDVLTRPPVRVRLSEAAGEFRDLHCGAGLFLEKNFASLLEAATILTARDQTLSYFGYSNSELTALAHHLPARAVDRIVPVGHALDFSPVWDGVDLFSALTRQLEIC